MTEILWCAECGDDRAFELPPCADDHGAECLDRACVDCGAAVTLGLLVLDDGYALQVLPAAA